MKPFQHLDIRHVYLKPGELFIDSDPALVQTVLGSCVSVTMYCMRNRFGGICHALLPSGNADEPCRHVEGAIGVLLEQMLQRGSRYEWLEVKLFGGSNVLGLANDQRRSVGEQNVARARELLQALKLDLKAADTGGMRGRKLFFNSGTGEVFVRKVRNSTFDDPVCEERQP